MRWTGMSLAAVALLVGYSGVAVAGHPDLGDVFKVIGKAAKHGPAHDLGKVLRQPSGDIGRVLRNANRIPRGALGGNMRHGGNMSNSPFGPLMGALGGNMRHGGNMSNSPFGPLMGGMYGNGHHGGGNGYWPGDYYGNGYSHDNEMAKAYRDVGIANAVVGLVGIAATVAREPAYYGPAYTTAAPVYAAPQPTGQWVRERVVVAPARYETYQVWIPEIYDTHTGQRSGGYYETRTRTIPEVTESRNVYVESGPAPY